MQRRQEAEPNLLSKPSLMTNLLQDVLAKRAGAGTLAQKSGIYRNHTLTLSRERIEYMCNPAKLIRAALEEHLRML